MPRGHARELMQTHVRTIMNVQLITVGPDDPLEEVGREIAAHGIGAVPVVDKDQRLVGIVSTSDLVNLLHEGGRLDGRVARDTMNAAPISIDEFATVDEAIDVMRNALVRHLPVTRNERLVGLVTASDLIRHLLKNYPEPDVA
jgi:arabinose-5-phosphate isomerase